MAGSCGPLELSSCCPASVLRSVVTRNAFSELCSFLGPRLDVSAAAVTAGNLKASL